MRHQVRVQRSEQIDAGFTSRNGLVALGDPPAGKNLPGGLASSLGRGTTGLVIVVFADIRAGGGGGLARDQVRVKRGFLDPGATAGPEEA